MIIYEFDEAIPTSQFIQHKCLRHWMEYKKVSKYDLNKYCKLLAKEFGLASELNSIARQSAAARAWSSRARFYDNCKKKGKGQKGFSKFKKHSRSGEYKTSGWQLSENIKAITFSDKKNIGTVKLQGIYDLNYYQLDQIKRVRIIKPLDGYYVQFAIQIDVKNESEPTGKAIGVDIGIQYLLADSHGNRVENIQFDRKFKRQLNTGNRQKSKKYRHGAKPQSKNYHKGRVRYARKHLRVSRQSQEYAKRILYLYWVSQSYDLIADEDFNVKGIIRNRNLPKSISDVAWSTFISWLEYFGAKYGKVALQLSPHYTSQNWSNCGEVVQKSLSVRTHTCLNCNYLEDRDVNAAKNILKKALCTVGHTGTYPWGDLPSGLVGGILPGEGKFMNQESPWL